MEKNKVIKLVPLIIAFVGIVICLASFFLPYASATSDHEKQLSDHIDGMYISEIGMTNGDAIGISPFEFLNINIYGAQNFSGRNQTVAIICVAMISAIAVFTLLCILFAALRKPVPLMIFDILLFAVFMLMNFDFKDRGIIPSSKYDWGIAYYLYFVGACVTLIGAVWLLVTKIKAKKNL